MTDPAIDPATVSATDGLLGWMLQYMRPYRRRIGVLSVLLVSEIGLGALQPWPFAIAIDHVLGGAVFPERIQSMVNTLWTVFVGTFTDTPCSEACALPRLRSAFMPMCPALWCERLAIATGVGNCGAVSRTDGP